MPIGVPRIIYCWGEELPAQWTDIYNFIFRRRMVFLMQYLDDELCNQICGLLINIHMEDRGKELEKKEIEKSGVFKNASKKAGNTPGDSMGGASNLQNKSGLSFEDLLAADEDLGITENNSLEDYTLQKITMEWLNWNAQFFDYSDEPYLFYLAEMLSKDFNKGEGQMLYSGDTNEMSMLMNMFKNLNSSNMGSSGDNFDGFNNSSAMLQFFDKFSTNSKSSNLSNLSQSKKNHLDVYSPFRLLANFAAQDYNLKNINPLAYNSSVETNQDPKRELFDLFNVALKNKANTRNKSNSMSKLLTELAQKDFAQKPKNAETLLNTSQKALSQRVLN
jgi:hypothetical protein